MSKKQAPTASFGDAVGVCEGCQHAVGQNPRATEAEAARRGSYARAIYCNNCRRDDWAHKRDLCQQPTPEGAGLQFTR